MAELLPEAAVFVVDGERNVVHWSGGAERLLGYSRDEAVGRLCLASIRCHSCTLGCGIARSGLVSDFPLELFRKDERWIRTTKSARGFFDDSGRFVGGIEVLLPVGTAHARARTTKEAFPLPPDAQAFHGLVSRDETMLRAFQTIRNVAETSATVLVRGESGGGKELVARAIHEESPRSTGPFVAVNCAALTPGLVESELFGHRRGAFTGAVRDRKGLFEQASGGTLFLDEVAELPLEMQSKLLRVLEERRLTPVGASREIPVDVRVIAATHRALREEVAAGRFRQDLLYRLRVVPIFLPPLRDRRGDVELLLRVFLHEFNEAGPRRVERISPEAMRALLDHKWPGNVRELRNVIEYAFAVGRGEELRLDELPPEFTNAGGGSSAAGIHHGPDERERIREALELEGGRVGAAAKRLGMSRATFWRKRRKLGL
ncbi:MAG TPA: PAS domain-containing protein [Deltaproteobacteria bacterium]|nr:PAS domain-containing protein [Deltaproteobacteria bacterium]